MIVVIVGVGLIGGSLAIALKEKGLATKIIGVDNNPTHTQKALDLKLVDECMPLTEAAPIADLIILAMPVDALENILPNVLGMITKAVVMDVGSIKEGVLATINGHTARGRFVATHPMWGTEYSGPEAAIKGAFKNKAVVICDKEFSDKDAVELVEKLYLALEMQLVYMNAIEHDIHVAYVSHI
jgi:prephenate dehydrogenase